MLKRLYSTDLSDPAWKLIAPLLPAAMAGGRPRTTDLRAVLNAIFYILRTGCQWRLLPREFPAWGTVYHYFRVWKNTGVWIQLQRSMYKRLRKHVGRRPCPSVVIMDGQSVKTTERGGVRGFDAYKRVKGRKRHILVDTLGLPIACRVEPANMSDRVAGARAERTESFVSQDQDGHCRRWTPEPQAGNATDASRRLGTANRQTQAARLRGDWSDVDRGADVRLARTKPPTEQRLRVQRADVGNHDRHRCNPPHAKQDRTPMTLFKHPLRSVSQGTMH